MEAKETCEIRRIQVSEVELLYKFMLSVTKEASAEYYSPSEFGYYKNVVENYGAIFGAFCNNELVAYAVIDFPGIGLDNFGYFIEIPENELLRVALLAGCLVSPAYRGQGLQLELCKRRERFALSMGCLHLFSTVHPANQHSLTNILRYGFEVVRADVLLEWGVRHILYKPATNVNRIFSADSLRQGRHPVSGRLQYYSENKVNRWT